MDELQQDVNEALDSSTEANESEDTQVKQERPVQNYMAEMNRKFGRMSETVEQLANIVQTMATASAGNASPGAAVTNDLALEPNTAQAINTVLTQRDQKQSLEKAMQSFPQLNKNADTYDSAFYKAVDAEFTKNFANDPMGPIKAAKLVAVEMGLYEQLERQRVFADETRRTRQLEQGTSASKNAQTTKSGELEANVKTLAGLMNVDQKRLQALIKSNPAKYGKK